MSSDEFFRRADAFISKLEKLLPSAVDHVAPWDTAVAYRWRRSGLGAQISPIRHTSKIRLQDLQGVDRQKDLIDRNTRQFLARLPANNVLLWGPRGTGKSSLIKALLNEYAPRGLRLIEVDKDHLVDLPDIVEPLYDRPESFLIFCDDLSFDAHDASYKTLKAALDGSIHSTPDNVLIYATSNRRHLLPEQMSDNLDAQHVGGEVHQAEAVEERISLSERFGLWLAFHPFSQDEYLAIVVYWLKYLGCSEVEGNETLRLEALRWALLHGSRSGRSAWQFARDWAGRHGLLKLEGAHGTD